MSTSDAGGPLVVDLRARLAPAGDQGRRGTCVAFAVTAVHEHGRTEDGLAPEDLAEEVLFWGAKQIDGDIREGTRFSSADAALRRWGQPAEHFWPYDEARDHRAADYKPPPEAIEAANCHMSALRTVPLERSGIEAELEVGRPVVIGIPVWDGLRRADEEPLQPPSPTDVYPTRHAVVLAGFDRGRSALLLRNSWGAEWGDDGYLWVDASLLGHATGAWVVDAAALASAFGDDEQHA